jgi:DNA-binding response OmpR family regulator
MEENEINKKRILIVEDEKPIARVMSLKFGQFGYEVIVAENGTQALAMIDQNFDCILLDLILPEKNGFDVLKAISETGDASKVIVLTNLGQPEDRERVNSYKVGGYYVKSDIAISDLIQKVNDLIKLKDSLKKANRDSK